MFERFFKELKRKVEMYIKKKVEHEIEHRKSFMRDVIKDIIDNERSYIQTAIREEMSEINQDVSNREDILNELEERLERSMSEVFEGEKTAGEKTERQQSESRDQVQYYVEDFMVEALQTFIDEKTEEASRRNSTRTKELYRSFLDWSSDIEEDISYHEFAMQFAELAPYEKFRRQKASHYRCTCSHQRGNETSDEGGESGQREGQGGEREKATPPLFDRTSDALTSLDREIIDLLQTHRDDDRLTFPPKWTRMTKETDHSPRKIGEVIQKLRKMGIISSDSPDENQWKSISLHLDDIDGEDEEEA
jgi:hypothetical protein